MRKPLAYWIRHAALAFLLSVPLLALADGAEAEAADAEVVMAELVTEGAEIFQTICSSCHGAEGQGGAGPRLDGFQGLSRPLGIIGPILWGFPPNMPSFGGQFTDREVAAVATFVRNAWSNEFGIVSEHEVAERR